MNSKLYPIKECPGCGSWNSESIKNCPYCGNLISITNNIELKNETLKFSVTGTLCVEADIPVGAEIIEIK